MTLPRQSILAVLLSGACSGVAQAQPLDAPPPLPSSTQAATPTAEPAKAAPARDAAADRRELIVEDEALADLPPARQASPETRIDQRRRGNRVVELTVTPAGSTRSYTIVNREGQRPLGADELSAGLSTPRFFRFDF
jgi:hypothetical protein